MKTISKFIIFLLLPFLFACSSTEFTIEDIEGHYLIDESGAVCVSVSFKTSIDEKDTVYATLTSPDGNLTWEAECVLVKNSSGSYRALGDLLLPYMDGGEWHLSVSRSDKTQKGSFILTPSTVEGAFDYPEFLRETRVDRVNGNVYTIVSPSIGYRDNIEISTVNPQSRLATYVSYLNGERQKNVAISTNASAVVFTYMNDEGTVFRKTNII